MPDNYRVKGLLPQQIQPVLDGCAGLSHQSRLLVDCHIGSPKQLCRKKHIESYPWFAGLCMDALLLRN